MQIQKPKHRLLVCGGRMYGRIPRDVPMEDLSDAMKNAAIERQYLRTALDKVKEKLELEVLIEGGAKGADELAGKWADENTVEHLTFLADWNKHGKAAGFIRNQQMLDEGKPTLVVAFPGGEGTKDMIKRAKKAGIVVYEITYETV